MERLPGEAAMVKSPAAGAFTTSVTLVVCVRAPSVPVMVRVYVPVGVVGAVVTVRVELEALGDVTVTGLGLNVPLAPVGKPLTLKVTVPLYPFKGVAVAVYEVLLPWTTVCEDGEADTEKSGTAVLPQLLNLKDARRVLQSKEAVNM